MLDLLTADYSFVNERIARHYGIPNVTGNAFRRVTLPDDRRGILGQGSVLVLTSVADRTSPVMRGKWVMEVLLGSPPPPPPPNVPALEETKARRRRQGADGARAHGRAPQEPGVHVVPPRDRSARPGARELRRHRQVAHQGQRRCRSIRPACCTTARRWTGPAGLRAALLKHQDVFLLSFTENLMTYALGRRVEPYDMPAVRTHRRATPRSSDYQHVGVRAGRGQQPAVPDEHAAAPSRRPRPTR